MTNEIDIDTSINCHYCNYQGKSENDLLKHSVNCHTRRIARPDKDLLDLIHNYDNDIELQKGDENKEK